MTNYSRTTLRELKKRYLNILKKCLLANLGIILLSVPAMAEEIVFDEVYDSIIKESTTGGYQGAFFRNKAEFGSVKFTNNTISTTHNLQGGFGIVWSGFSTTFKGHVLVENNTFGSGTYGYGGFINVGDNSAVTFETAEFVDNIFSGPSAGGVLSNERGFIYFKGDTLFQGNTAGGNGAVIYNQGPGTKNEDGTIEKYGITFDKTAIFLGNASISGSGGAIYNGRVYSGTILFQDDAYFGVQYNEDGTKTILGNEAVNGGAIYSMNGPYSQSGTIYNQYSTIDFKKNTEFVSNEATNGSGGAIYNNSNMNFMRDVLFEENKATGYGGAIYNTGTIVFGSNSNVEFLNNSSAWAGAVHNTGRMSFLGSVTFENNIVEDAYSRGGAVVTGSVGTKDENGNILEYGMTINNGSFLSNKVTTNGHNAYLMGALGGAVYIGRDNGGSTIKFSGHTVFGGYDENGISLGNIAHSKIYTNADGTEASDYAQGGAYAAGYEVMASFDSVDFIGNKAISEKNTASGGAFLGGQNRSNTVYSATVFNGPVLFKENEAVGTWALGGAINNGAKGQKDENDKILKYGITFKDTATFYSNKTRNVTTNGVGAGRGGAIYNTGTMIFEDKAVFGGYKTNTNGDYILDDEGNKTSLGNMATRGGAIDNMGIIEFSDVDFINNIAVGGDVGAAGAIHSRGGTTIFNGLARFYDNIGYGDGGAIYAWSANITFNNKAEFVGNKSINDNAGGFGGAITHLYDSNITFNDHVLFKNNEANGLKTSMGGALSWGLNGNTAIIKFSSAEFIGNKVSSIQGDTRGGAIHNVGGSVVFEDTVSNVEMPAVPNITYGMTFNGDTLFTGNKAESETGSSLGGAIFNQGYMLLAGENTFGGYLQDTEDADEDGDKTEYVLDSEGNKISLGNEAKYGGAIHNAGGKKEGDVIAYSMTLGKSTFMGNTALSTGGAVYNSGYMNFTDETTFEGNISESETGSAQGGAITNTNTLDFKRNVTFQNNKTQGNTYSEGGAIYNTGYMNFKSADFISNSVIADATYARGGAIYNTKDITFSEKVLFSQNSLKGITEAQGGAIRNIGTMNFSDVVFNGNSSTINSSVYISAGGSVYNGGKITIQTAEFENNKALGETSSAEGGAIKNLQNGNISILESAIFKENLAKGLNNEVGGAVDNRGQMTINNAVFTQNKTQAVSGNPQGGAVYNGSSGEMTFSGNVEFRENQSIALNGVAEGGAIKNRGILTFNGFAQFTDNIVEGYTGANGGAIYNESEITFNNGFEFSGNKTVYQRGESFNDIVNIKSGTINFAHGLDENGVALIGSLDGGIANSGTINKTGAGTLILGDAMVNSGTGTFNQTAGLTIAHADHFLTGTNNITGGELRVHGANMDNLKASVSNDALLTFLTTETSRQDIGLGANVITTDANVKFGAHESIGTAKYHLIDDVTAKTITIENADVTAENNAFNGAYIMGENVTLNMQDGDTEDSVGFKKLSGESSDLLFDIELKATTGEGLELASDKLSVQTPTAETYKVKVDLAKINVIGEVGDNGLNETYTTKVLEGEVEFETATNELKVFTDVYKYDVTVDEDKQSIKLSGIGASGENALKEAMDYEGDSAFKFSVVGKEYAFNLDTPITLGRGDKIIVGQGIEESKIASGDKKMFVIDNENTSFKISDVKIVGTGEVIENKVGSVTLEKVAIEGGKVINKDELVVEESSVHVVENAGTLTATSSELGTVTNAGTLMLDTAEVSELENAGTLTANGSTIGALVNEKDAEVTGGKVAKVTNKGELTVTGATTTELLNEHEATITGGELETATNKEKGMLSLSAGLRAGTVTNEGELTLDGVTVADLTNSATLKANGSTVQKLMNEHEATITGGELETATNKEKGMLSLSASLRVGTVTNEGELTLEGVTVADLTNSATLKANGSTIQKLVNEQEAELTASTVEDLTNTSKMIAKDLTVKGALKGTGTATLSGKLVADDIFKSENKIISDGMEVSENIKKMELSGLEIKEGTTLDIGTREVTAKDVIVGKEATLQVTLNNLDEFGTMKADKIEAGAGAGVHLVLGEKFEGGVFDVFKGTKGAGDLEVKHNNLYNVIEVEEGKYSFMTKDTEALQESLVATKEEVTIAEAMTKGTASHEMFARMQSEVLVALQSLDTQTVEKAKKALKAVGISEQPSSQSIAASHFNELTRVISQMAMEKEAEIVGHSGGDTDPRAKVYVKGLYDRTKSSQGEGFRARSKGAVLGVQSQVMEDLTIGVGYAFSQTTAKEDLRRTEVDTNTGFISAHYQPNAWWLSALGTFSRGQYEEEKQVLSSMGKADYNVDSWGAEIMTGYDFKFENGIITPEVGMRYLSVKQESYTDSLGTKVSGSTNNYLTALVGVKGVLDLGSIRPTAGLSVGYDVVSDDAIATNTLANGASYTVNGEALERLSTTFTTGVEADVGDRTTVKLEYSGTFRKEYQDHSGMLKLEVKF